MSIVTVVVEDKIIIVDGDLRVVDMAYPSNLRAIQLDGVVGEAEWTDGPNTVIDDTDVAAYVTGWTDAAAPAKPNDGSDYFWNNVDSEWQAVVV